MCANKLIFQIRISPLGNSTNPEEKLTLLGLPTESPYTVSAVHCGPSGGSGLRRHGLTTQTTEPLISHLNKEPVLRQSIVWCPFHISQSINAKQSISQCTHTDTKTTRVRHRDAHPFWLAIQLFMTSSAGRLWFPVNGKCSFTDVLKRNRGLWIHQKRVMPMSGV